MKLKNKDKVSDNAGVKAVLIGIIVSILISVLGAVLTAYLMGKGSVTEKTVDLFAKAITFISALLGCLVCVAQIHEKIIVYSGCCAGGYLLSLIAANILLFEGKFSGIALSIVLILLGSAISAVIRSRSISTKSKVKF